MLRAFSIFVLTETWLVPVEGYLIDRFGPKIMVCGSGVLVAIAWVINSIADSLTLLYIGAAIGGIGAGVIYGASVGNALKWFPDRRGLAAGLTVAGFGAGSALTVIPIVSMIQASGYQTAFLWFGLGQGIVVIIVSLFLRAPEEGEMPASAAVQQTRRDYAPMEVIKTPVFWVMYLMFVMVGSGGIYGRKFATTNYGLLYTAKGTASLLVPLANVFTTATGSWHAVFVAAAILNVIAAVMALLVLKPMRLKAMAAG